MPDIHYSNASFFYKGKPVLNDISFSVKDGQHCGIVGEIGSGKTMLLKSLTGVLPLQSGSRKFMDSGLEISAYGFSCLTQFVEFAEQNKYFKPSRHFYQQRYQSLEDDESRSLLVEEYLKLHDVDTADAETREFLSKGKITELLHRKLIHISSGQRKRLQLTMAIIRKPKVLLLDCPYTGVDVQTRRELNLWLKETADQFGIQLIIAANESDLPDFIDVKVSLPPKSKGSGEQEKRALDQLEDEWCAHANGQEFESMVKMRDVSLAYGEVQILKNLSWEVKSGEKVGLKGQNGSGKSSLLSLVYGDNPLAYNKEIYLFDRKRGTGESIWDIKRNTGFVSSEFHLYMSDNITCGKLIATGYFDQLFIPRKLTEAESKTIDLYFDYYGAAYLKDRFFHQISLGEQRLTLLIRALIKNPTLLLLDEPYHGFDDETITKSNRLIETMIGCSGNTLIFISHDSRVMPDIVHTHYELKQGEIHQA